MGCNSLPPPSNKNRGRHVFWPIGGYRILKNAFFFYKNKPRDLACGDAILYQFGATDIPPGNLIKTVSRSAGVERVRGSWVAVTD